jgi:DNA primase
MTYDSKYKVVLPVIENGSFRGYVKRRTDGMDTQRKYLFNEGFKISKIIMGNYQRDWVVITEGSLDWLKLQQNNFPNSCAILKWKASNWQLKKLMKVTDRVISALDDTETGEMGTEILRQNFKHVVRFPFAFGKKDCGEMEEMEFRQAKHELRKKISEIG